MFPMNLLRRLGRYTVASKDEASRTRRVRARRNPVGLEPLEERQLLAADVFMVVGGGTVVVGESTSKSAPKGSFDVADFNWGVSNPATVGGSGIGIPSAPNFSITKQLDRASIGLFAATTRSTQFKTGTEVLVVSAATQKNLLEYDFTNVYVTSAQLSYDSSDDKPVETDTFSFEKVTISYWLTNPSGTQTKYSTSYDFKPNVNLTSDLSTSTAAIGASNALHETAGAHAASHVNASHKANAVDHRLTTSKVSGTRFSKSHRILAAGQSLVHGKYVASL
jgi:type VI protein secretion system component Hcp